jgi:hypothetical protein
MYRKEDIGCVVENGESVSDGLRMCRGERRQCIGRQ